MLFAVKEPMLGYKTLSIISEQTSITITRSSADVTTGTITNPMHLHFLQNYPDKITELSLTTTSVPPTFEYGFIYAGRNSGSMRYYEKITRTNNDGIIDILVARIEIDASTGDWTYSEEILTQHNHLYRHICTRLLVGPAPYEEYTFEILNDSDDELAGSINHFKEIVSASEQVFVIEKTNHKVHVMKVSNDKLYIDTTDVSSGAEVGTLTEETVQIF